MKKLYKENKPMFFRILMIFWLCMTALAFVLGWDTLSKLMCLSLAASSFVFVNTSKKDEAWIAKYGDPDEFAKKMAELEAEQEAAAAAEVAETPADEEIAAESAPEQISESADEEAAEMVAAEADREETEGTENTEESL